MSRRPRVVLLLLVLLALGLAGACGSAPGANDVTTAAASDATGAAGGVKLTRVGTFHMPTYVAQPPGDDQRLFVVQQGGKILIERDGKPLARPFLDVSKLTVAGGERGLLSIAFAPDYATSGLFYVDYTDHDGTIRVVEYHRSADPDRADPHSARLVLSQVHPVSNHNGGLLMFGPDRLLYIGIGDGGGHDDMHGRIGNGQNRHVLLGKILRIDPRQHGTRPYAIPRDNPFVGQRGVRPEIYAWGLRNPWRYAFDRANGDMVIADVGQAHVEEVDFRKHGTAKGVNFGWRVWEGTSRHDPDQTIHGDVKPVLEYTHDDGGCSITGGFIFRDPRLPSMDGRYVYGDFCAGNLLTARLQLGRARDLQRLGLHVDQLSSFGEDQQGRVYVVSLAGPVYRFDPR